MHSRSLALAILEETMVVIQSETVSDLDKAVAVRELRKATSCPKFEAVWIEAREYLAMISVSKVSVGASLALKSVTEGEGAGGVWLPRWTTPVGKLRGMKLATALFNAAGFTSSTAADGTVSFKPTTTTAWIDATVGERIPAGKR